MGFRLRNLSRSIFINELFLKSTIWETPFSPLKKYLWVSDYFFLKLFCEVWTAGFSFNRYFSKAYILSELGKLEPLDNLGVDDCKNLLVRLPIENVSVSCLCWLNFLDLDSYWKSMWLVRWGIDEGFSWESHFLRLGLKILNMKGW